MLTDHDRRIWERANKLWSEFKDYDAIAHTAYEKWDLRNRMGLHEQARMAGNRYRSAINRSREIEEELIRLAEIYRRRGSPKARTAIDAYYLIKSAIERKART